MKKQLFLSILAACMLFHTAYADDVIPSEIPVGAEESIVEIADDSIEAAKIDEAEYAETADDIKSTLINADNDIIEAEDVTPLDSSYIRTSDYASNGKVVRYALYDRTEHTETFYIEAEEAGEYNFEIAAANIVSATWLSGMYISVNDEKEFEINKTNFEVTVPAVGNAFLDTNYPVNYFKYKKKLTLNEGMNTMAIRFTERNINNGGKVHAVIDYIKLRKDRPIDGLTVELKEPVIAIGEETEFIMKNGAGVTVKESDAQSFSMEFDSFGIAEVSGAKIKGLNTGSTGFTITATKGDVTETVKGTVTVLGTGGMWIENAKRNGKTVSFDVKSMSAYAGGDNVIIAVYGKDGDCLTSLKAASTVALESIEADGTLSISEEIDGLGDSDVVQIFIFSSRYIMRTLYGKTVL